jgi:hypothetical protein
MFAAACLTFHFALGNVAIEDEKRTLLVLILHEQTF